MPNLRIIDGFEKLSDADLEVRSNSILTSMTDNPNFTTPTPTLTVVAAAITDFSNAVSVADGGSSLDKAIKNDKRLALINLLNSLGNYVIFTVDGNRTKAMSSGFTIAKVPSPMPPLSKPENLQVTEGPNAGDLNVRFKRVIGGRSYLIQYAEETTTGEPVWQNQTCTTSKFTLRNLESGKKYQIRVAVIGAYNQLLYSDPVWRIAQ